jgi:hypothetical protein
MVSGPQTVQIITRPRCRGMAGSDLRVVNVGYFDTLADAWECGVCRSVEAAGARDRREQHVLDAAPCER